MAAVLPPVLEALLRASQGNQNSAAFQTAMPMGASPDPRQVSMDAYDPRMAALLLGADPTPRPVTPMDVTPMPVSRQESMANADRILAASPGAEAHQADLARSAAFINELNAAIQSPQGPVGMRQGAMDEVAMQFPDKAYPVGTTVVGGGDMSYMPRGPIRDGRLSALTTALSGLGAPMGYQAPAEPDPRTMVIRPAGRTGQHVGALVPNSELEATLGRYANYTDGAGVDPLDIFSRNVSNLRSRPDIKNREAYDATQQRMADRSTMARDLITQRAIQEANARSLRQSGMDPRTAALLGALGQDEGGLGGMYLTDQLLGKGSAEGFARLGVAERASKRQYDVDMAKNNNDSTAIGPASGGKEQASDPLTAKVRSQFDALIVKNNDPTASAKTVRDTLVSSMGFTKPEADAIIKNATGIDLQSIEKNQDRHNYQSKTFLEREKEKLDRGEMAGSRFR